MGEELAGLRRMLDFPDEVLLRAVDGPQWALTNLRRLVAMAERLLRIEAAAKDVLDCDCDDLPFDCPHKERLREALADMEANR